MSYDLMVFDRHSAPLSRPDFMQWYEAQTQWPESHAYDDPAVTSVELRNWFMEMITQFPPMNGPFAHDDPDSVNVTDYCIGSRVIYAAFAWSVSGTAYEMVRMLAQKYGVGFFNVSTENEEIIR